MQIRRNGGDWMPNPKFFAPDEALCEVLGIVRSKPTKSAAKQAQALPLDEKAPGAKRSRSRTRGDYVLCKFVIVATGFSTPFVPDIEGIEEATGYEELVRRTTATFATISGGINNPQPFLPPGFGKLDDENGVFAGETDQQDQPKLSINTERHLQQEQSCQCAECGQVDAGLDLLSDVLRARPEDGGLDGFILNRISLITSPSDRSNWHSIASKVVSSSHASATISDI